MKLSESFYNKRLLQQNGNCYYCGKKLINKPFSMGGNIEIDHILPKSKFKNGQRSNLCLSCKDCNRFKSDLLVNEFRNKCLNSKRDILKNGYFYFEYEHIYIK